MTAQQWEKEVIKQFFTKTTNSKNNLNYGNVIYELFQEMNDPVWDCHNLYLIGFGETIYSNNKTMVEQTNTLLNQEFNDTIVLLQNKVNNKYLCLRFVPTMGNKNQNEGIFSWDSAVFDNIKPGIQNKNNWVISSIIGDQIEIKTFGTKKYNFYEFLSPICLKINNECVKQVASGDMELYSKIYDKCK